MSVRMPSSETAAVRAPSSLAAFRPDRVEREAYTQDGVHGSADFAHTREFALQPVGLIA
jgi:hypothetical protein